MQHFVTQDAYDQICALLAERETLKAEFRAGAGRTFNSLAESIARNRAFHARLRAIALEISALTESEATIPNVDES